MSQKFLGWRLDISQLFKCVGSHIWDLKIESRPIHALDVSAQAPE